MLTQGSTKVRDTHFDATLGYDDVTALRYRSHTATDREIDQLIYELYGLTDHQIALVEEATG